jgi:hypothetical protein
MGTQINDTIVHSNPEERAYFDQLSNLASRFPVGANELCNNLGLFLTSKNLSRILFFYEIYKKVVDTHGVIFEFGTRYGQTIALLSALRGIFEPFNRTRKIVGFDTFAGFKGIDQKDGKLHLCQEGSYSVPGGYEEYLEEIMIAHENLNPIQHIKKFELIKGDITETLPDYLTRHPETIISMVVFDLDLYRPTKMALESIKPYLCKGSLLVFDDLVDSVFPGETEALRETMGMSQIRIKRIPMTSRLSYLEIE